METEKQKEYRFTEDQLDLLLVGAIEMFIEYRTIHGCETDKEAMIAATKEMFDGLDSEREMHDEEPEYPVTMQVYPLDERACPRQ